MGDKLPVCTNVCVLCVHKARGIPSYDEHPVTANTKTLLHYIHMYKHTYVCNSYNMDARALAYLLHEGAKRPRAINELSA